MQGKELERRLGGRERRQWPPLPGQHDELTIPLANNSVLIVIVSVTATGQLTIPRGTSTLLAPFPATGVTR